MTSVFQEDGLGDVGGSLGVRVGDRGQGCPSGGFP